MKKELFLHIYTEEIPNKMQQSEAVDNDFIKIFIAEAKKFGIELTKELICLEKSCVRSVVCCEIDEILTIKSTETKGPKLSAQKEAIDGFLRKNDFKKEDLIEVGDYFYHKTKEKSVRAIEIIPQLITNCFEAWEAVWPSVSTWAEGFNWPRPIRGLNVCFGNELVDVKISDVTSTKTTIGHKFKSKILHQDISSKRELDLFLTAENIVLDVAFPIKKQNRLELIKNEVISAQNTDLTLMQEEIIKDVNTICESVWCIVSEIDKKFAILPSEVIVAVLKNHLKYIPLVDKNGNLTRKFAIIIDTNEQNENKKNTILKGNMTVLNARLEDALFFFNKDKSENIDFFKAKLSEITFDKELGSLINSINRMSSLYKILKNTFSFKLEEEVAKNTINLIKLDLGSSMISEFCELQGFMIEHYFNSEAKNQDLLKKVAIYQYKTIIEAECGNLDRQTWEILFTIWLEYSLSLIAIGKKPTSSKDPFGIRRRLKYVFQTAVKHLNMNNFEEKLPDIISKYCIEIEKNINEKEILEEILKHKND